MIIVPVSETKPETISVGVVCMTSAHHLSRCLAALRAQRRAPHFDVTVVIDPSVSAIDICGGEFPDVRFVTDTGPLTPLQLVSRVLRECRGDLILLTKDHCVPGPDWVRGMVEAQAPGRAAVGGRVEPAPDASATDWAFFFIDFYRYTAPVEEGPTSVLTVCNVSYARSRLEAVRDLWTDTFVEAAVNRALAARFGALWMHVASEVTMHRHLTLREALRERCALGRVFGWSRIATSGPRRRLFYATFAPALPLLLLGRLTAAAMRSRRHRAALVRSLIPLTVLVVGRSWGEWLAYVTGRPPRGLEPMH